MLGSFPNIIKNISLIERVLVHHKYMRQLFFSVKPTMNGLINLEIEKTRNHAYEHKATILNKLQRGYLELREEWGINYPITGQDLYSKSDYPKSSFTVNFGGGMRSFFALSEQVVIERFAEAVKSRDFEKGLKNGFQSLLTPINFSDYNTNRQNGVDMALRTQFCYKVFGLDYWKLVLKPLIPALDSYLAKAEPRWNNVADEAKTQAYDLFTEEFHWIVGLLLREHSKQQEAPDPFVPLDEYVNIYSQIIRTTVLLLFSDINLRDTLFEKYLGRMQ